MDDMNVYTCCGWPSGQEHSANCPGPQSATMDVEVDIGEEQRAPKYADPGPTQYSDRGGPRTGLPLDALNAPPIVRRGDVLLTLGHEIALAGQQLRDLAAFRDRVVAAAEYPDTWMRLRDDLDRESARGRSTKAMTLDEARAVIRRDPNCPRDIDPENIDRWAEMLMRHLNGGGR
jgi:hypothetical protein